MKSHIGFRLAYLDLTLAHYKSRGRIYKIVTAVANTNTAVTHEVAYGLSISIYRFDLVSFKDQLDHCNGLSTNILAFILSIAKLLTTLNELLEAPTKISLIIGQIQPTHGSAEKLS